MDDRTYMHQSIKRVALQQGSRRTPAFSLNVSFGGDRPQVFI
jgi:hypothetical protein